MVSRLLSNKKKIAVFVVILFMAMYLIRSLFSAREINQVNIMILDQNVSAQEIENCQQDLSEKIPLKKLHEVIGIHSYSEEDENSMQAFSVHLISDDVDIIIAPKDIILQLMENNYLVCYGTDSATDFYADFAKEQKLYKGTDVYAIQMGENSRYLRITKNKEKEMYLAVTVKKKNDENLKTAAEYFLEESDIGE